MSFLPRLANEAWRLAALGHHRRFAQALEHPREAQADVLAAILRANADTEFGRAHSFASIRSAREYAERVPLTSYDELVPAIERIRAGETGVLTREPVRRLVPSSGSTAARKLLPCTDASLAEFRRAIGPWIVDLFTRPGLRNGRAYWAISPALPCAESSAVPVGFAHDSEYLEPWARALVRRTLAVGEEVAGIHDIVAFRYSVLLALLRAPDLALVSVWHPSYLTLLLGALPEHWERLLDDVGRGGVRPPVQLPDELARALSRRLPPDRRRAAQLRKCSPDAFAKIWPRLVLVSCWGDGPARGPVSELARALPGVEIQPKGLVATEAFVSLPFRGTHPLAIRSHFLEFQDDAGAIRLAHELETGSEYKGIVTTGGGLYRYALRDRVRVEGHLGRTPSVSFVGKEDGIADLRGEKLSDGFVASQLRRLFAGLEASVPFAMLAPTRSGPGPGYALFFELAGAEPVPVELAARLEHLLWTNPHYRWCVELGQLAPVRCFRIFSGAHGTYEQRLRELGRGTGNQKPVSLSPLEDWERWFHGRFEPSAVPRAPVQPVRSL